MVSIEMTEMNRTDEKRPWDKHYSADRIDIVIDTPILRVLDAGFAPGQQVPWHRHTNVIDHFWVIAGRLRVETQAPDQSFDLGAGGYCAVSPGCEHRVTNIGGDTCHFINLQGFGAYDFIRPGTAEADHER